MISSRWLVTADWHFTNKNSKFRYDKNGVSDLLNAQYEFGRWLANRLMDDDIDGLLMLGDATDYATLDPITATLFYKTVDMLVKTGKHVIFLEGNHCIVDDASLFTVIGAINPMVSSRKVHCIIEPRSLGVIEHGVRFFCRPYESDYKALEKSIEKDNELAATKDLIEWHNVLLFHFPTVNAVLDNGVQSMNGVNLSQEITDNFTVCLGGDFHKPQQLVNNDNAYYVGAPFDLKMNQKGERGVGVLDLKEDGSYELSSIPNPFNYPMQSMEPEALVELIESGQDLSRCIVKVNDAPTDGDRLLIEAARDRFYSLSVPNLKKHKKEKSEQVSVIQTFSKSRDVDIIKSQLDQTEAPLVVRQKAIDIFQKLVEED